MGVACDASGQAALVLAWFGLRAEDRGTAAVVLHGLRYPAARIVAARCRCGIAVAEDHVADAVFVMLYRIRRVPRLRIPATTTLAYLCGVARNEWRWDRWRRARECDAAVELTWRHNRLSRGSIPIEGTGCHSFHKRPKLTESSL